jgi:hypothetical protein
MDFIYSKSNVLSKETCEDFINTFESSNLKKTSELPEDHKKATEILFHPGILENKKNYIEWYDLFDGLVKSLNIGIEEYVEKYSALKHMNPFSLSTFNLQKYIPGEGFYGWHCERNGDKEYIDRLLVWMIYLNDVDNGGTEFLYQNHTETAEAGKLLIWPADFTHTHRGVISNTETKYILTGWYSYKM